MKGAAIAELEAHLSRYVARVKAGPVPPDDVGDDKLRDLERQGLARRARRALPAEFWTLPRSTDPEGRLLRRLLEERDSGR